jgi:hypothetical protein
VADVPAQRIHSLIGHSQACHRLGSGWPDINQEGCGNEWQGLSKKGGPEEAVMTAEVLWITIPLVVLAFALWVGVPMWIVLRHPDRRPSETRTVPVYLRERAVARGSYRGIPAQRLVPAPDHGERRELISAGRMQ